MYIMKMVFLSNNFYNESGVSTVGRFVVITECTDGQRSEILQLSDITTRSLIIIGDCELQRPIEEFRREPRELRHLVSHSHSRLSIHFFIFFSNRHLINFIVKLRLSLLLLTKFFNCFELLEKSLVNFAIFKFDTRINNSFSLVV